MFHLYTIAPIRPPTSFRSFLGNQVLRKHRLITTAIVFRESHMFIHSDIKLDAHTNVNNMCYCLAYQDYRGLHEIIIDNLITGLFFFHPWTPSSLAHDGFVKVGQHQILQYLTAWCHQDITRISVHQKKKVTTTFISQGHCPCDYQYQRYV